MSNRRRRTGKSVSETPDHIPNQKGSSIRTVQDMDDDCGLGDFRQGAGKVAGVPGIRIRNVESTYGAACL